MNAMGNLSMDCCTALPSSHKPSFCGLWSGVHHKIQSPIHDHLASPKVFNTRPFTTEKETSGETIFHPFVCRLNDTESFEVSSPNSLIGAGFASLALSLFTFFRTTPFLLIAYISRERGTTGFYVLNRNLLLIGIWIWMSIIFCVLFFFGLLLVASTVVRKRWMLMLHPWGLLLLYFDVIAWLALVITVHVETYKWPEIRPPFMDQMYYPDLYFLAMYFEVVCFALLYYLFSTFFISAELTIIEKFYP